MAPRSLLQLGSDLLVKLLKELDGPSRLRLFQTCTRLRDLVLASCPLRLTLHLPITQTDAIATKACLRLACQTSTSLHLHLAHSSGNDIKPADVAPNATWLLNSDMDCTPLHQVTLEGLPLDGIIPSWLAQACTRAPALTKVNHYGCSYAHLPAPVIAISTHVGINQLVIEGVRNGPPLEQWRHQLKALPGLQSLMFCCHDLSRPAAMAWCSVIGTQLTSLTCRTMFCYQMTIPSQLPKWYPNLRHLHLPKHRVTDDDMDVLLKMPNLQELSCKSLVLQRNYLDRPCPWTQFHVTDFCPDSFARLHLPYLRAVDKCNNSITQLRSDADAVHNTCAARCCCPSPFTWFFRIFRH